MNDLGSLSFYSVWSFVFSRICFLKGKIVFFGIFVLKKFVLFFLRSEFLYVIFLYILYFRYEEKLRSDIEGGNYYWFLSKVYIFIYLLKVELEFCFFWGVKELIILVLEIYILSFLLFS